MAVGAHHFTEARQALINGNSAPDSSLCLMSAARAVPAYSIRLLSCVRHTQGAYLVVAELLSYLRCSWQWSHLTLLLFLTCFFPLAGQSGRSGGEWCARTCSEDLQPMTLTRGVRRLCGWDLAWSSEGRQIDLRLSQMTW